MMIRIRSVKPLKNFKVELDLTNGDRTIVDLEPYLHGPIFAPLRGSYELFRTVRVDEELGTIVWENGADIDPDVLILHRTPASAVEHTPQLKVKEAALKYRTRKKRK